MRISHLLIAAVVVCVFSVAQTCGEEDRYLDVVRGYADAMLAHGRDTYGQVQSPLFASALDRKGPGLLKSTPDAPEGVRDGDRTLSGSNMMHDENLLRLLFALSDLTGDKRYARAADEACGFFFTHCQSKATGLMVWGEHLGWDFQTDSLIRGRDIHEYYRPWVLWDRCYALAPKACLDFARGVWEHQIADHNTGNFNRHARFDRHGPERDKEFSRHAGFYIATWAAIYGKTKDPELVHAVEVLMDSFERRRSSNGRFPGSNPRSDLSWAIDIWDASAAMPETLARRMRSEAEKTDDAYCRKFSDGIPADEDKIWKTAYGDATTAAEAMICYERYRQTDSKALKALVLKAAEVYLTTEADRNITLYPGVYGEVVSLLTAAYRITGDQQFLKRATAVADESLGLFWNDGPLPRCSSRSDYYEAITRADTLALSLLELWSVRKTPDKPLVFSWIDR